MPSPKISSLFLAACLGLANAQGFPDASVMPGCGQTCLTSMTDQASSLNCDGASASCLCANTNFVDGVRDCASGSCATDLFPSVTNYISSVCATATIAAAATTSSSVVATTSAVTSTPAAVTSDAVVATTAGTNTTVETTAVAATSSAAASSTSVDGAAAVPTSSTSTSSTSTTKSTSTSHTTSSSTSSSSASSTASAAANSSLSTGAKAGIGIGSAVGGVAVVAVVAMFLIARKHKSRSNARSMQISDPMPGSGRLYANGIRNNGYENVSELEMKAKRYEDMVPRHTARNVV